MFVAWAAKTWSNHSVLTEIIPTPQQPLDRLKKAGKPRKGVSPSTVYVSSPNVKSERKYKDKHLFYAFASF